MAQEREGLKPMSVSEFCTVTDRCLRNLGTACVEGEIGQVRRYTHLYFTLKDENSAVNCIMWSSVAARLGFEPESGMKVVVTGQSSLYAKNGSFSLLCGSMRIAGRGESLERLLKLKDTLEREGVFAQHKRPLPQMPLRVGVITSPEGRVVHDICETFKKRRRAVEIRVYGARVQGEGAAQTLIDALKLACEENCCDALIIGRGGGSFEDLLAFSDEALVRAVAGSTIPIVSAVGHEPDFALTDFSADARAATPTAAAEILSPVTDDMLYGTLADLASRLSRAAGRCLDAGLEHLAALSRRLESAGPAAASERDRLRLEHAVSRLCGAAENLVSGRRGALSDLRTRLEASGPGAVLDERRRMLQTLCARADQAVQSDFDGASGRLSRAYSDLEERSPRQQLSDLASRAAKAAASLIALNPLKVLTRGYSVTLGEDGKAAKFSELAEGGTLVTLLEGGRAVSKITALKKDQP
ncbi:MAG: exodeoxyribonuclease VII large subunit [Succinivibrio sp.]|nr:exodeoxyribonuclease VII large subunit [Succinivibrio sp.]